MSDDKARRPNSLGTDPMQRLPSLKPSRDLTLGAGKSSKKLFIPNLNVARNKHKSTSNQGAKKEDRHPRDRRNDKSKNFRGQNVIKSTGVFSEGISQAERTPNKASSGREADKNVSMQKPNIRIRDFVKIDKEREEKKLRVNVGASASINDDPGNTYDPSVDFKKVVEKDAPTKLPIGDSCWLEPTVPVKIKQEVKTEPEEYEHFIETQKPVAEIKHQPCEQTEVVKLLRKTEPTLILLQLPDTLPGRGAARDTNTSRRKESSNEGSTTNEETGQEKPGANRCSLSDLEDGRIGTLRTHRSGRVTLLMGDTVFEVNMGTKPTFHQEVVSASCDEASRSASLISLGALTHKLSIVPDWENLFKEIKM